MKTQFFYTPTMEDIEENTANIINTGRSLICLDINDIRVIARDADNVLMLEGHANGSGRVADAIEDAVLQTCSVANEYDLFSVDKVLLHLSYSEKHPILLSDSFYISQFADMFQTNIDCLWGFSIDNSITDDTMIVRILASNLKLKNIKF